ncbi:NERD domain-containing protein [Clostridium sardiniense]|uniref:NERD domain-containing protein n=1 Tax=Clostridium sardiniense TaxID=29369 RepID=A0ABS7L044_CLOSR|nr:nuclease-related domain-containing protein [Clostridium sardiniense]MBY0756433.1 NERD domain-containing protein [Clostridium sardiniense]MDQ0460173.1 hypothetical protein [Clostridium sardiniense]
MAILVDVNNIKDKNKENNKFELNKFVSVIAFIISIFIVNLILEIIDTIIDISGFFGEFYDLVTILLALLLTYIYLRRKYISKKHDDKEFINPNKNSDKNLSEVVPEVLSNLDNNNYILKNFSFNSKKDINHIDTLVVNKSGVFVIYIRYDKGRINGNAKENKWILSNGNEDKKINNPIIVVNRQKERLKEYLIELGYNIDVKSIIYYVDNDLELNVRYSLSDVYIFNKISKDNLIEYIESYKGEIKMSSEDLIDIILKIK